AADTHKPVPDRDGVHADRFSSPSQARGGRRAPPGLVVAASPVVASPAAGARSGAVVLREAGDALISDTDKARIIEAIRAAEEKTAGEIFCGIARARCYYPP